jgi:PAS domain S-box-containing protein
MEAREKLRVLAETSPAATITTDEHGFIELANRAATELLNPRGGRLVGRPIAAFFPELHHTLRWVEAPQFRTSIQCHGHRDNGGPFTAEVCCSTYKEGPSIKLVAIVAAVTAETAPARLGPSSGSPQERAGLSGREAEVLGFLVEGLANKEIAARMDISASMVKYTLQQLFAKIEVRTRAQLVKAALERYPDLLPASAATQGTGFPDQTLPGEEPRRHRLSAVAAAVVFGHPAAHQSVSRVVRPAVLQPVSRAGRHRGAQRTVAAKRAAGVGGF